MPIVQKIEDSIGAFHPLRVTKRQALKREHKKRPTDPRILVRCGCCAQRLEIYADTNPSGSASHDILEINGVLATVDQWRKLLGPMLGFTTKS